MVKDIVFMSSAMYPCGLLSGEDGGGEVGGGGGWIVSDGLSARHERKPGDLGRLQAPAVRGIAVHAEF